MRTEVRVVAYLAIIVGLVALCVGWSGTNQDSVIRAAGVVMVAGLALLGAAAGLSTWQEERKRAREQHQRDTYAALVQQLVSRFTPGGKWDAHEEVRVRAQVAIWAEPTVLQKLGAWQALIDRQLRAHLAGSQITLSREDKAAFEKATAELVQAVRKELSSGDTASVELLTRATFNNPSLP